MNDDHWAWLFRIQTANKSEEELKALRERAHFMDLAEAIVLKDPRIPTEHLISSQEYEFSRNLIGICESLGAVLSERYGIQRPRLVEPKPVVLEDIA